MVDEIVNEKLAVTAYPAPVVLRWADYSKLAQEVLTSGFTFEFDETGKPHINTLRPLVRLTTDFDAMEIAGQAVAAGCLDKEAIWILEFGARSHSTPPYNSVFFPNHSGAVENAAGMAGILDAELELQWMRASPHPPFGPIGIRPVSLVPKTRVQEGKVTIYGYRLITDGSFPGKGMKRHSVRLPGGKKKFLAPNFNFVEGSQEWLHYTSISEIAQATQPLLALAQEANLDLLGKCFDFEKWFRQIGHCNLDRWQIVEQWKGQYLHDTRVTMGCVHSSNTCQRIAYIILDNVERQLDAGLDAAIDALPDQAAAGLIRAWIANRQEVFPDEKAQWRPWHLSSYQDDTPAMVIGPLAPWLEKVFTEVLTTLRVPLSGKEGEFAKTFEAIGGRFDFSDTRAPKVGPSEETQINFRENALLVRAAVANGETVDKDLFASFTGQFEWVCKFLPNGPRLCAPAHKCKRAARFRSTVLPSGELGAALDSAFAGLDARIFRPLVRDPSYLHGGTAVSADASTSYGCGFHVGGHVAAFKWEAATLDATEASRTKKLRAVRVSISPLELLTQALLAAAVGERIGCSGLENGQVILRCDNQSACDVVASRRPHSPAMAKALELLEEVEAAYGLKVRLEYIRTDLNRTADALSKGDFPAAAAALKMQGRKLVAIDVSARLRVNGNPSIAAFALAAERAVRDTLGHEDLERL